MERSTTNENQRAPYLSIRDFALQELQKRIEKLESLSR